MQPHRVIPALNGAEAGHSCFGLGSEPAAVQRLAFERAATRRDDSVTPKRRYPDNFRYIKMAVDVFVLFNGSVPTYQEVAAEAKRRGFAMELADTGCVSSKQGFRPVTLGSTRTGFFVTVCDPREILNQYPTMFEGNEWNNCIEFSTGSPHGELQASVIFSAALAHKTDGVLFDPQAIRLYEGRGISELVELTLKYLPLEGVRLLSN